MTSFRRKNPKKEDLESLVQKQKDPEHYLIGSGKRFHEDKYNQSGIKPKPKGGEKSFCNNGA